MKPRTLIYFLPKTLIVNTGKHLLLPFYIDSDNIQLYIANMQFLCSSPTAQRLPWLKPMKFCAVFFCFVFYQWLLFVYFKSYFDSFFPVTLFLYIFVVVKLSRTKNYAILPFVSPTPLFKSRPEPAFCPSAVFKSD